MYALETNSTLLHYDKIGKGPLLIFIPGASGTYDSYVALTQHLKQDYSIVLYDRSGYGASELLKPLPASIENQDDTFRLTQDVNDLKTLIETLSKQPVHVFGTDTGAVVGLKLALDYPQLIDTLWIHEPLNTSSHPDKQAISTQLERINKSTMIEGIPAAMRQYESLIQPSHQDMQMLVENTIAPCAVCAPDNTQQRSSASTHIWLRYEMRQYMTYQFDLTKLAANQVKIRMLQGKDSKGSLGYESALYLSHALSAPINAIAGGHYGYIQAPLAFAQELKQFINVA